MSLQEDIEDNIIINKKLISNNIENNTENNIINTMTTVKPKTKNEIGEEKTLRLEIEKLLKHELREH